MAIRAGWLCPRRSKTRLRISYPLHQGTSITARTLPAFPTLRLEVPAFTDIHIGPADHNEVLVVGGQSDRVMVLSRPDPTEEEPERKKPVLSIIAESQLDVDEEKWLSWPHYHSGMRRKLGCRVWLVAVCPRAAVARWARQPVPDYQPDSRFVPLVLGPDEIPQIRTVEEAQQLPALAVLSAVVHANQPDSTEVVAMGLKAADLIAQRGGRRYHDIILKLLDKASAELLEKMLMENEDLFIEEIGQSYLGGKLKVRSKAEGIVEGETKGKAELLLYVISDRGLSMTEQQHQRILSCRNPAQLDTWFRRALRASSVDELLA